MKPFFKLLLKNNPQKYLLLFALLVVLSPYLYLSFFAHPVADDYCYALTGKETSFPEAYSDLYLAIGGRYTTNALEIINPLVFDSPVIYWLVPAAQIIILAAALVYFFRALTLRTFSVIDSLNFSLSFLLLFLHIMPSLADGLYFYSSAIAYTTQLSIAVLYFGLLLDYCNGKIFLNKYFHVIVTCLVLVVAMGFTEVLSLLLICFHFYMLVKEKLIKGTIRAEWALFSFLCLACFSVMLFSPGNNARAGYFPESHNFSHAVLFTAMQTVRFSSDWISDLPLILLVFLFAERMGANGKSEFLNRNYFFSPRVSVLLLAGILFVCIFPPYWATNILGQHRTVNTACFFFLLFSFICSAAYLNPIVEKAKRSIPSIKSVSFIIIAASLVLFATTRNGYVTFTDIFYGTAKNFSLQMQLREKILEDASAKKEDVVLAPITSKPKSLFTLDLQPDSAHWINYCQAKYFGVKSIVCKE